MEILLSGSVDEVILADLQFVIEITTTIVTNPRSVGKILFFIMIAIKFFKKNEQNYQRTFFRLPSLLLVLSWTVDFYFAKFTLFNPECVA